MNFLPVFLFALVLLATQCFGTVSAAMPLSYAARLYEQTRRRPESTDTCRPVVESGFGWNECWWTMQIDNFNFATPGTYQMRYLINNTYWRAPQFPNDPNAGPVFFYTGNEGAIDLFATNTGLMWDLAPKFNALLVFAEHRYYGESLPFGAKTYTNASYLQYLTAEQALADYATFIPQLMTSLQSNSSKVIAFGGSYGGMLTAWFRLKYPWIVSGGIAASAPVRFFTGQVDPDAYSKICSDDFTQADPNCGAGIAKSWDIMTRLASTPSGLSTLNQIFQPCTPMQPADVQNLLFPYIGNVLANMPMGDYPYPTTFLGPMPGNPVNYSCTNAKFSPGQSDLETLQSLAFVVGVFYNSSTNGGGNNGNLKCNQLSSPGPADLSGDGWPYQSCNEMVMPIGQYGPPADIFYPAPWNLQADIQGCQQSFGITPRPYWIQTEFGFSFDSASNIFLSSGTRDPWHAGDILHTKNPLIKVFLVEGGAHHYDLRASNPADTPSVIKCRQLEAQYIQAWLAGKSTPEELQEHEKIMLF